MKASMAGRELVAKGLGKRELGVTWGSWAGEGREKEADPKTPESWGSRSRGGDERGGKAGAAFWMGGRALPDSSSSSWPACREGPAQG